MAYDELLGPDLDAARWSPMHMPLPTGGEHIALDPNAEVAVGEGEVRGPGELFVHVVESPYEDFEDDFTRLRPCEITFDRSTSTVAWHVDGHKLYEAHGTLIPERARIGLGIYTQLPIRDGRSRSLAGQGMSARWGRVSVRGVAGEWNR